LPGLDGPRSPADRTAPSALSCRQAAVMQFLLAATMNSLRQLLDLDAGPVDTGVLIGVIGDQCPPALLGA
jgi:hypothetical protein